ncbi:alpha/beta fold hydrolase [Neobacillus sp. D3-1R]|uniref:alpha/beta fold hydrolase n=1 Tax=Neobacillus sp. D3-1R TaxID=3445778 RepID=UPI003F9F5617
MITLKSGFAEVNGAKIFYEMKGEGQPIVMIHGHPLDSRMWDYQFDVFSEKYQVIRFDLAGYGQSGVHENDFSLVEDIKGLLDYLKIEQIHLIGLSVGGMLSMDFTLAYPERVNKLILVSSGLLGWNELSPERQRFNEELNAAYEKGDQEVVIELMTKSWVAGPFRELYEVNENVPKLFSEMVKNNFSKERGTGKMILPPTKTIDLVDHIKVPTLIVTPEMDFPEFSAISEYLNHTISDSQKVIINGTAHMINMEKPKEFNEVVLKFLK